MYPLIYEMRTVERQTSRESRYCSTYYTSSTCSYRTSPSVQTYIFWSLSSLDKYGGQGRGIAILIFLEQRILLIQQVGDRLKPWHDTLPLSIGDHAVVRGNANMYYMYTKSTTIGSALLLIRHSSFTHW